jgi:chemotaxis protein MotB
MKNVIKRMMFVVLSLVLVSVLTGCTDWKKKYDGLEVEHQNLMGRYDNCMSSLDSTAAEKVRLNQALLETQRAMEQLQAEWDGGQPTGLEGLDWTMDTSKGTITVTLPNAILFAPGKATLIKSSISEIDQVMGVLRQRYPSKEISVVGHTDSDPIKKSGWKDNWELSTERALAVVRYMVKLGLCPQLIKAAGAGEYRPVSSNSTSSGKGQNRRVEIVIHML